MSSSHVDALRISPRFTSNDWNALNRTEPRDWTTAAEILRDRVYGRFLSYADQCLPSPYSGFVVLAIDSLLLEALQQFRRGVTSGRGKSESMVVQYLSHERFQPDFDETARKAYYSDIRCGLLHQAEAKRMWLIRRDQQSMLTASPNGDGYVIDVRKFHAALHLSLDDYLRELVQPRFDELRANLWNKMDHICNVRIQRGAVYAV